jgi:putative transposase
MTNRVGRTLLSVWVGHSCPTKVVTHSRILCIQVHWSLTAGRACSKIKSADKSVRPTVLLEHRYEYRRKLPHYQKADWPVFISFRKLLPNPFSGQARELVLQHCMYDHGKKYQLHAAMVMPDHVHLLITPLRDASGRPHALPAILKLIKGTSARSINKLLGTSGPVWQEESFDDALRSEESLAQKLEYIRQNPVRSGLVQRPEKYPWLWVEQL